VGGTGHRSEASSDNLLSKVSKSHLTLFSSRHFPGHGVKRERGILGREGRVNWGCNLHLTIRGYFGSAKRKGRVRHREGP